MRSLRLFVSLLKWDLVRELRRREAVANMCLFALLVLFVGRIGIEDSRGASSAAGAVQEAVGPVLFWIAILFAGTIGLSQTFVAEREGDAISAITTAPIDPGVFYLSKVAAVGLYVAIMEVLVLGGYIILFNFDPGARLVPFLLVMSAFTLGYMATGVVLAAMTTTLRGGGEVVLRILIIPLMLPVLWYTLRISEYLFDTVIAGGATLGPPLTLGEYLAFTLALDTIYLTAGYVLFPKVLEE
jgi:heme exporter protein B